MHASRALPRASRARLACAAPCMARACALPRARRVPAHHVHACTHARLRALCACLRACTHACTHAPARTRLHAPARLHAHAGACPGAAVRPPPGVPARARRARRRPPYQISQFLKLPGWTMATNHLKVSGLHDEAPSLTRLKPPGPKSPAVFCCFWGRSELQSHEPLSSVRSAGQSNHTPVD